MRIGDSEALFSAFSQGGAFPCVIKQKGKRNMAFSLHGVHVPHRKNTRKVAVLRMTPPQTVEIPMSMHIGRPATPIVKVGDTVKVGQKIGEADGYISSPI